MVPCRGHLRHYRRRKSLSDRVCFRPASRGFAARKRALHTVDEFSGIVTLFWPTLRRPRVGTVVRKAHIPSRACPQRSASPQTLLGAEQKAWFKDMLPTYRGRPKRRGDLRSSRVPGQRPLLLYAKRADPGFQVRQIYLTGMHAKQGSRVLDLARRATQLRPFEFREQHVFEGRNV